jgi:hypothetical protein
MTMLLWIGLLGLLCVGALAQMPIAAHGKAQCVVVTQPDATAAERHAAHELAETLHQITGATFSIVESGERVPEAAIIIGPGPAARALFPEVALERFGNEQLTMRTRGKRLLLAGGRPRGTLYAVYRFLQEQCGVRWWTPLASTIPHKADLVVPELTRDEQPAFESRDPYWYPAFNADWAVRNGSNSQSAHLDAAHGGSILYKGFVHTSYPLVPPEKYAALHPEWYSLINGKRVFENAQLCTTNPELRDFLVDRIRDEIRESPDATILSLSQNDCFNPCECPVCKELDDREGSHSASMLAMVNYVAERIGKEYPNVAIDTLAYQYTRKAPKDIKPLPNVIVRLCSIECNFAAPLDDASNRSFANDIIDWNRLSKRLYIWDYTTNFAHYVQPHPNWFVLGPNLRFFHNHGARGVFEQGAYQSSGSEMSELRAWVLAQLLWNPDQDDRKLIREFLDGYYGKAAPAIWEYMNLLANKAKGVTMGCYASPSSPYLDFDTLSRAERLWKRAEAAVKSNPDLVWRVQQGHLPVRYVFLSRWSQLRRDCMRAGAQWPLPASRKAVADAWLATATGSGPAGWTPMTHINEGGVTPQAFVARFAVDPPEPVQATLPQRNAAPPLPTGVPGANAQTCVDAQDNDARLYNEGEMAEVRADPAASDGLAVWMPGNHHEWATQFPFAGLPARVRKGKWRIYALIRVDKEAGADAQSAAFTAGIYDTGANVGRAQINVSVHDAADTYTPYLLGTVDTNKDQYVWIAPTANPGVKAVWVDRVYFVPANGL